MVGTHEESPDELMSLKDRIIDKINSTCYDEPATGICAIFPKQFLHFLEVAIKYLTPVSHDNTTRSPTDYRRADTI